MVPFKAVLCKGSPTSKVFRAKKQAFEVLNSRGAIYTIIIDKRFFVVPYYYVYTVIVGNFKFNQKYFFGNIFLF